ncbi:CHAP domain-containing protein [Pseudarthrobacter oxydans]|uniref:CHAP domain-containing protein n=1 Tax=Pseudarthrobacter oxydans TaxID=1671 RepID=UPI0035E86613|nr:hypothetical protein GCM10017547_38790 [Pseudarthrobacter oxydans]
MNLQAFIDKYTGVAGVGNTPENTGECVGLVMVWTASKGLPHTWGHARDLLANADRKAFMVIADSETNYPEPGDVLCMDGRWGGGYGHTGIVVRADAQTYTLFEQNNPKGSAPHLVDHPNYYGVQGWMRSKTYQGGEEVATKEQLIELYRLAVPNQGVNNDWVGAFTGKSIDAALQNLRDDPSRQGYVSSLVNDAAAVPSLQLKVIDLTEQAQAQQKTITQLNEQIKALQTAPKPAETTPVVQPPTSTTPATPAQQTAPHTVKTAVEHFLAGENGKIALQIGGALLFYVLDNAANFGIPSGLAAAIGLALGHTVANRTANKVNH